MALGAISIICSLLQNKKDIVGIKVKRQKVQSKFKNKTGFIIFCTDHWIVISTNINYLIWRY